MITVWNVSQNCGDCSHMAALKPYFSEGSRQGFRAEPGLFLPLAFSSLLPVPPLSPAQARQGKHPCGWKAPGSLERLLLGGDA